MRCDREQLFEVVLDPEIDETDLTLQPIARFEAVIDQALRGFGLRPLGSLVDAGWIEIDRERARRKLVHAFRRDLAYGTPRRDATAAAALAGSLLGRWPEPARFLSGSDLHAYLDEHGEPPAQFGYACGNFLLGKHEFEDNLVVVTVDRLAVHLVADDD